MKHLHWLFFIPLVLGQESPMLSLKTGTIRGHYMSSRAGNKIAAFESIPYAEPPLGELRWKPAVPMKPWEGILNCSSPARVCPQKEKFGGPGQEDCLYLNLYLPFKKNISDLPVMVWIHGGGLQFGAGSHYGPEFLIDEEIILVTFNYRLGVLGFLSLDTPKYSGNQGFRDLVLVLQWVQDTLEPEKVTIFGESAGSESVSYHILSPQSKGLFQAAIGQSGTVDKGLAFEVQTRENAFEQSKSFALAANCSSGSDWNNNVVLDCLREINAHDLVNLKDTSGYKLAGNVDDFAEDGPILPDMPEQLLKFGLFNQVPAIWGSNLGEGSNMYPEIVENPSVLTTFDDTWAFDGPIVMFERNRKKNGSDFHSHDVEYAMAAREFYFDGVVAEEKLADFVDLITDTFFLRSVHNMVLDMSDFVPVYQYYLTFRDNTSFSRTPGIENVKLGPTHFDDVPYLFRYKGVDWTVDYDNWSQANLDTSLRMCKMWANFAREMNPTPVDGLGIKWEKVFRNNHMYLDIGEQLVMDMSQEYKQRMEFWDNIIQERGVQNIEDHDWLTLKFYDKIVQIYHKIAHICHQFVINWW